MEDAFRVFNKMPSRDAVPWTAMIGGYAIHRHGKEALQCFGQMCKEGVQPDDTTFVCLLLSACSHAGLVDEGPVVLFFNDHSLHDFCKIGTLHLHDRPSWSCWPSTGGRKYDETHAV